MQLDTTKYQSNVLMGWLAKREGGVERAGVKAMFPENGAVSNLNVDELAALLGATRTTHSGAVVTPETAMRVTTVYACVSLIAGAISTLPLPVYERQDDDSRTRAKHDYWWFLNEQANEECSAAVAWEFFIASRLFYGDAFAEILRPSFVSSRAIGWRPLHPSRVEPFFDSQNVLRYRVTDRLGKIRVFDAGDILHVPSLGFNGLRSPSPITYAAREAIGTSLAAEEFSARFFSQGSTHDIALKTAKKLDETQIGVLLKSYVARYGGGENNRVPLILTGGLEVEKLSINPVDAALIQTRQFGVEEICRPFGVPPFMVGATDKTTSWGAGIEQQGIGFVKYTLRRHLSPIEQEFNRKLWPNREKYFVEYNTAALERGDFKTRMEGYRIAVGRAGEPGWLTPDEVRHAENFEPIEGGDKLNPGTPPPTATEKAAATALATLDTMQGQLKDLGGEVRNLLARPQQPITVNAPTTIAEGAVKVDAPVTVSSPVTIAEGAIKNETLVDANTTLSPGAIQLELPIRAYPMETEEVVTRDDKGEIKSILKRAKE
jgi:HK97 family phage portal protein